MIDQHLADAALRLIADVHPVGGYPRWTLWAISAHLGLGIETLYAVTRKAALEGGTLAGQRQNTREACRGIRAAQIPALWANFAQVCSFEECEAWWAEYQQAKGGA